MTSDATSFEPTSREGAVPASSIPASSIPASSIPASGDWVSDSKDAARAADRGSARPVAERQRQVAGNDAAVPESVRGGGGDRDAESKPPSEPLRSADMSGLTKAAVFILSLEEEAASKVLRCLSDEELSLVAAEIANIGVIDRETVSGVMRQFLEVREASGIASEGGLDPASRLLQSSLPPDRATQLTELLAAGHDRGRFSFLSDVDVPSLVACLEEERHQTIAVVLAQMNPARAADVLERLTATQRKQVLRRIASLERADAKCLELVEQVLRKHFEGVRFSPASDGHGVKAVAEILRAAEEHGRSSLFDDLKEDRPELAEKVSKHLLDFGDLAGFDDRRLAQALKSVDLRDLALALRSTDNRLAAKVSRNLSRRSAHELRQVSECLGPVRLSEVEAARRRVLEILVEADRE